MPITSDSTTIEASTWRRDAPSVRSVASSRVRWAIVIESEFAITKLPTKSAIAAEREQEVLQEARELLGVLRVLGRLRLAGPHLRCPAAGSPGSPPTSCSGETPGLPAARIWSSLPCLSKSRWAVGRSKPASVAPPIEATEPNLTSPEIVQLPAPGPRPGRRSCSPTARSFLSAVALSIDDLVRARPGAVDERERVEVGPRRVDGEAEVRGAAEDDHLAVLPDQVRLAADAADRVGDVRQRRGPCRAATRRTAASVVPGRFERSNADFAVIVASVPR